MISFFFSASSNRPRIPHPRRPRLCLPSHSREQYGRPRRPRSPPHAPRRRAPCVPAVLWTRCPPGGTRRCVVPLSPSPLYPPLLFSSPTLCKLYPDADQRICSISQDTIHLLPRRPNRSPHGRPLARAHHRPAAHLAPRPRKPGWCAARRRVGVSRVGCCFWWVLLLPFLVPVFAFALCTHGVCRTSSLHFHLASHLS